jgi:hypothetical protein
MAVTRRLVWLLAPMLALAAGDKKKQVSEGPTVTVVDVSIRRLASDPLIVIEGHIVNSSRRSIAGLELVFEVTGMDGQVVSRQRGRIDEDPFDPGEQSEFHWQMDDQARAVRVRIGAVARGEHPVAVDKPGPYAIE